MAFAVASIERNLSGVTRIRRVAALACPFGNGGRPAFLGFFCRLKASPYAYYCTPRNRACQGIYVWYSKAMKVALIAVILLLVQASPPLPRQTPKNSGDSANSGKKNTDGHKSPTSDPMPTQGAIGTADHQGNGDNIATENKQPIHAIVDTLPKKDGWDIVYIIATWALVLIGCITLGAILRQTILMHRSIVSQFRPKLIVRRVIFEFGTIQTPGGKPAKIHYTVANTGGTDATIVNIRGSVLYANVPGIIGRTKQPLTPPAHNQEFDLQESISLRAGEDRQLILELDHTIFEKIRFIQAQSSFNVTNPDLVGRISILAEIQYSDRSGTKRKTGILRFLDIESRRFTPSEDKEYEYAD